MTASYQIAKPIQGSTVNWGHPHSQGLTLCAPFINGSPADIAWGHNCSINPASSTQTVLDNTRFGGGIATTASATNAVMWFANNFYNSAQSTNSPELPLNSCSIAFAKKKLDTTNRQNIALNIQASGFNITPTGTRTLNIFCPNSDGNIYFQYGGTSGANQLVTSSPPTFGDDIFVFTAGFRGMTIWQNGVLIASSGTAVTRVDEPAVNTLCLNGVDTFDGITNQDLAIFSFIYTWQRELTGGEIVSLSDDPYSFITLPEVAGTHHLSGSGGGGLHSFRRLGLGKW